MTIDKEELRSFAERLMAENRGGDFDPVPAIGVTAPDVLALLAEIERLEDGEQVADDLCAQLSEILGGIAVALRGPEKPSHRHGFSDLPSRVKVVIDERDQLKAEIEALRKEREGMALVPMVPSEGLLMSMAIRHDHGLGVPGYYDQAFIQKANHGVTHARMVECALSEMRQIHEEVVGAGFYTPAKESGYSAMAKESSHD